VELLSDVPFLQLALIVVVVVAMLYGILLTVQAKEAMDDLHHSDDTDDLDPR
jgi:hypothetical protein